MLRQLSVKIKWVGVRKGDSHLFGSSDICELQFGIVREVCYYLVLQFTDLLSLGTFQLLDLLCGSFFGLCAIRNSYLVFDIHIWYL